MYWGRMNPKTTIRTATIRPDRIRAVRRLGGAAADAGSVPRVSSRAAVTPSGGLTLLGSGFPLLIAGATSSAKPSLALGAADRNSRVEAPRDARMAHPVS